MRDFLGCLVWAVSFILAGSWIPYVGPFVSLLTPLPFIYFATKRGLLNGVILAGLTTLVVGVVSRVFGHTYGILFCLEFSVLGLFLMTLYKRQLPVGTTVLAGTAFVLAMGFVFLSAIAFSRGMGPLELVRSYLQSHLAESLKMYEGIGAGQERAAELGTFGRELIETISRIYPGLMITGAGFIVWVNVVVSRAVLRMGNLDYPQFEPMDHWQSPEALVWGVILSGFALFLPAPSIKLWATNALIVLLAIYVFHGLSIVLFFLNKYRVPSWVRVGIYALIALQQLFLALMAVAGLFDQWIDFRKIHRRKTA